MNDMLNLDEHTLNLDELPVHDYNQGLVGGLTIVGQEDVASPTTVLLSPVDPLVAVTRVGDYVTHNIPVVARALYTALDSKEAHVVYQFLGQGTIVLGNAVISLSNAAYVKIKQLTVK